jgi:threonine/homoserine/homoserine lactone efflux protein
MFGTSPTCFWKVAFQSEREDAITNQRLLLLSFPQQFIPSGAQVWSFGILLALIHATQGFLWFLLLTNATELISGWLRQRRVVVALVSAMGGILVAFGLKLAYEKAR